MKSIKNIILLLTILLTQIILAQYPENFLYDIGFIIRNEPNEGSIKFTFSKLGIIFSGDNFQSSYCEPQVKIYKHEYQRRIDLPGCPFLDEPRDITGLKDKEISWRPGPPSK